MQKSVGGTGLKPVKRRRRGRVREIFILFYGVRDSRTPWHARLLAVFAMVYLVSPFDLIPDFIPVAGYLDDLIVVPLLLHFAYRALPADVKDLGERKAAKHLFALRLALAIVVLLFLSLLVGIYFWVRSWRF